ncbi:MAG: hypothetical protein HC927_03385 [Deltaproteobacteria bacterium]|nr:hypothetical protein [Deltaproteobacteria bacterium]
MTVDRSTLKNKFKQYAIPSEADFHALIDGQLNQADDGIFKDAGQPLSIHAEGVPALRLLPDSVEPSSGHWSFDLSAPQLGGSKYNLGLVDNGGTTHLFFDTDNARVGVGTTTPSVKLEVSGTTRTTKLGVGAAPAVGLDFQVSNNGAVLGNLGVGTSSPSAKLDVIGQVKASNGAAVTGLTTTTTLGVGTSSVTAGYVAQVNGNQYVTNYLGVGDATVYGGVQANVAGLLRAGSLHVQGAATINGLVTMNANAAVNNNGAAMLAVASSTNRASIGVYPADNHNAEFYLYTAANGTRGTRVISYKLLDNGVDTNRMEFTSFSAPLQVVMGGKTIIGGDANVNENLIVYKDASVYGELNVTKDVTVSGGIEVSAKSYFYGDLNLPSGFLNFGAWNISIISGFLVFVNGAAAVAFGPAGKNRLEMRTSAGYYVVKNDGSTGVSASADILDTF